MLADAPDNIARWREVHAGRPVIQASPQRWSELLDEGSEVVATMLTEEQRAVALASFRSDWPSRHVDE